MLDYSSVFLTDTINPLTMMLLVNAIYFKGLWRYPFNMSDTKEGAFYVTSTHSVTAPFMRMERELYWTESVELDSSILRLPYMVSVRQCSAYTGRYVSSRQCNTETALHGECWTM
jgi:serine protease inhibitor